MLKIIKKKNYYLYSLLISFSILLFTSKCSFLYPFNDWVDANAFFTVGKSIFKGVVPYRDLFEQKGLILYFIYGIGSLISYKSFYGVFILEVFSFSIFLYYAHKIFNLFLDKKYSIILLPILGYLITTSTSFVHGGSCEEFCLSFLCVSFYYYFKHFKVKELTNKEIMLNGALCGCIFMMKYTILGYYIGFVIFIIIYYLRKKSLKKIFNFCLYFLIGVLIPVFLCLLYLGYNNAIKDYIDCYFIVNMTKYVHIQKISDLMVMPYIFCNRMYYNGYSILILLVIMPIYTFLPINRNEKYLKYSLFGIFLCTIFFIFCGLRMPIYYFLPLLLFLIIPLIYIATIFSKVMKKTENKKYKYAVYTIIVLLFIFLSYYNANYKKQILSKKNDYFQFKYAKYINKYKNPTLLNYNFLDLGLYTTTGIVPRKRFFELQNIDYDKFPENIDEMKKYIKNKDIDFIICIYYYNKSILNKLDNSDNNILTNYKLVYSDTYMYENTTKAKVYLFKLKDL